MYAQLEEDHGLAKRSMSIFDRATQVVADEDKFEVNSPDTDGITGLCTLLRCSLST